MDGKRQNILKEKLEVSSWKDITQKQFNGLVANLSFLDQETVRTIIKQIPNVTGMALNYFNGLNKILNVGSTKEYLDALNNQQKILLELIKIVDDPSLKIKIADELLEHSKWLRKEATQTRFYKKAMIFIGLGLAFFLVRSLEKNLGNSTESARTSPAYYKARQNSNYDWNGYSHSFEKNPEIRQKRAENRLKRAEFLDNLKFGLKVKDLVVRNNVFGLGE